MTSTSLLECSTKCFDYSRFLGKEVTHLHVEVSTYKNTSIATYTLTTTITKYILNTTENADQNIIHYGYFENF